MSLSRAAGQIRGLCSSFLNSRIAIDDRILAPSGPNGTDRMFRTRGKFIGGGPAALHCRGPERSHPSLHMLRRSLCSAGAAVTMSEETNQEKPRWVAGMWGWGENKQEKRDTHRQLSPGTVRVEGVGRRLTSTSDVGSPMVAPFGPRRASAASLGLFIRPPVHPLSPSHPARSIRQSRV